MQSVSTAFGVRTEADMRPITQRVLISFDKDYDPLIDFFTIGVSTIGGTDILKGDGNVVNEWDKYDYEDYSDRLLKVDINRETDPPTNPICLATCDLVFDNHDDLFTPGNTDSPLDGLLVPRRPVKVNLGFGGETIPKFVGVTVGTPQIDDKAKTATFHCIDFLNAIMNISLDEEVMYIDMRTDEIISELLQTAGLSTSQFSLDYGSVIIPFAYFKKGSKIGDALKDLAEAELGNVRLAENGQVIFENRQNWYGGTVAWDFSDTENVLERKSRANSTVINVVEVFSKARAVQANQSLWINDGPVRFSDQTDFIPAGEEREVFINFQDKFGELPVTNIDDPEAATVGDTSVFAANTQQDSSGDDMTGNISVVDVTLFSTAAIITLENTGSVDAYVTLLEIFGTPASVVNDLYVRVVDPVSVGDKDAYEERPLNPAITNDLIQDAVAANTIGQIIISDRGDDDDQQQWIVKSVPQLQIGDVVRYQNENTNETYFVTKINDIVSSSGYKQILQVSKRTINTYFRIGISTIGGSDALGP